MNQRHAWIAVLLILAAGVAARSRGLAERTLSFDEAFSWRLVNVYSAPGIVERTAADVHPPFYYLLLELWTHAFGESAVALRSLSVLLAGASLPLVYVLARDGFRWAGGAPDEDSAPAAGVIATLLVATSGAHIRWSGEARMYSLACLLGLASTWLLARGVLDPSRSRRGSAALWGLYALTACLSLYTHNYMIFVIAAQDLWLLLYAPAPVEEEEGAGVAWRRRRAGLAALAVACAAYAPWIPVLHRQADQVRQGYWFGRTGPYGMAQSWADLIAPRNQLYWGEDWAAATVVGLSLVIVAWLGLSGRRIGALLAAMIAMATLVPVAMTLYWFPVVNNQTNRYWLVPFIFFVVGVSIMLCRTLGGAERWLFAGVLVANNVYWAAEFSRETRLDLMGGAKAAVEYIQAHGDPDESIVVREPDVYLRLLYYLRNDPARERLYFLPNGDVAHYNGGPLISEREMSEDAILVPWRGRKVWAVDGATLLVSLDNARLLEPWEPAGPSQVFAEPIRAYGKVVVTESVYVEPAGQK